MHGYQLIQEIGERSGGQWRPSPGAIYPALNLLEDEGLVAITAESGRKMARLTEAGTAYVTENAEQLGSPFEDAASRPTSPGRTLRGALEALAGGGPPGRPLGHRRPGHPGARGPRALAPGPLPDPGRRPGGGRRPRTPRSRTPDLRQRRRVSPAERATRTRTTQRSGCRRRLARAVAHGRAARRPRVPARPPRPRTRRRRPRSRPAPRATGAPRAAARAASDRRARRGAGPRATAARPSAGARRSRRDRRRRRRRAPRRRRARTPPTTRPPPSPPRRRGRPRRRPR